MHAPMESVFYYFLAAGKDICGKEKKQLRLPKNNVSNWKKPEYLIGLCILAQIMKLMKNFWISFHRLCKINISLTFLYHFKNIRDVGYSHQVRNHKKENGGH